MNQRYVITKPFVQTENDEIFNQVSSSRSYALCNIIMAGNFHLKWVMIFLGNGREVNVFFIKWKIFFDEIGNCHIFDEKWDNIIIHHQIGNCRIFFRG